ncbi:PREDICTED: nuclear pore complex protein DDB_G0274915-like [Amphimedon queenslandica]|uniref:Fibronectin type-III domain-containing protein n=1 Tax=Amphimedon queenslandica TaxID=400682 RepID=A0A1X7UHZ4_AMPQE|nr:PREDICTED: nuclear pore complex protein DDB_G0274915-like [Amphimedon queenslandica]|eukprot:XP_019854094.1 PREDICTED: nuclear pore complex protein DDB_G0274915-like [Amphimedon queenslandica]
MNLILVIFFCFSALQFAVSQPATFPSSGVELHHTNRSLPLYPQLASVLVTSGNKLWCSSASTSASISWKLPGGTELSSSTTSGSGATVMLVSTSEGSSLGLAPTTDGTLLAEGIYKCCVTDDQGNEQVLESFLIGSSSVSVSDTSCFQSGINPNRFELATSISHISPTIVSCRDQDDTAVSGTITRNTLNDTAYRVGVSFTQGSFPFTVSCAISNGPSGAISTVTMTCRATSSLTAPSLPSSGSRFVSGTSVLVNPNSFLPISSIASNLPLWCSSSNANSNITWTLPDGTVLGPTSPPSGGVGVISSAGQLGLVPSGNGGFPSGVYTCSVNGVASFLQIGNPGDFSAPMGSPAGECLPISSGLALCANLTGGLPTSASCSVSGSSFVLSSIPTAITKSTVPIMYRVCVPFTSSAAAIYSCTFANAMGTVTVGCNTIGSVGPVQSVTAVRNTNNPSSINVTWTPINSPYVQGYNISVTETSTGTTQYFTVGPGSASQTIITNINPQNAYTVTVTPVTNDSTIAVMPSTPVTVRPIISTGGQCNPAEGFIVDILLTRNISALCNCSTIESQAGLPMRALQAALGGSNAFIRNCTDPILHLSASACYEDFKEKTRKTIKFKTKFKTGKSKKTKKTKKTKKGRTKTVTSATGGTVNFYVRGLVLCGSCSRNSTTMQKRDVEVSLKSGARAEWSVQRNGMERMRRHVNRIKRKRTKSKKTKTANIVQEVPPMVAVDSKMYNVYFREDGKSQGLFCGNTTVTAGTLCDCPSQCNLQK